MSDPLGPPNLVTNSSAEDAPSSAMPSMPPKVSDQPDTFANTDAVPSLPTQDAPQTAVAAPPVKLASSTNTDSGAYLGQASAPTTMPKLSLGRMSSAKSAAQTKWDQMYQHLLVFKEKHGHCLVPNRYKENPQLGSWVSTQRRQHKSLQSGQETPLTKERAELLESVGFVWATRDPRHVPWEQRYQELVDYKAKHGDCLVPIGYKTNIQLSNWVSTQRQEYKLLRDNRPTRLTEERIRLLNEAGFVWEAQRGGSRKKRKANEVPDANKLAAVEPIMPQTTSSSPRPTMPVKRLVTNSFRWHSDAPAGEVSTEMQNQSLPIIEEQQAARMNSQQEASVPVAVAPSTNDNGAKPSSKSPATKDDDIFADAEEDEAGWSPWSQAKPAPATLTTRKVSVNDNQTDAELKGRVVTSEEVPPAACEKKEAAAALLSVGGGKP